MLTEIIGQMLQAGLLIMLGYFIAMFKEGILWAKEWNKIRDAWKEIRQTRIQRVSYHVTVSPDDVWTVQCTDVDDGSMMASFRRKENG